MFLCETSVAMRIGARYKTHCADLLLSGNKISYGDSFKYLGIVLKCGKSFSCSYDHVKLSFYRAFNLLYSRSKSSNSELTSVFLMRSYCMPIIHYALEATAPPLMVLRMFDNMVDNSLRKIFNICNAESVHNVRCMVGINYSDVAYHRASCEFLLKYVNKTFSFAGF